MSGKTLTLEVPDEIRTLLPEQGSDESVRQWMLESAVIEGYREGRWSQGKVAQLLRLSWAETEALLQARGVPLNLTPEDVQEETATLQRLFGTDPK